MSHPQVPLGEIADLIRGITYKPTDVCDANAASAVACMRTKNVQEALDESDIVWIPGSLIRNQAKYLKPGDILVSSANSWNLVGKGCWVPELRYPASAGGFISILREPFPSVSQQNLFAKRVRALRAERARHAGALASSEVLLNSLQYRALSGELKVLSLKKATS